MGLGELTWSLASALAEDDDWLTGNEQQTGSDLKHDPWLTCSGERLASISRDVFGEVEALSPTLGRKPRADALERRRKIVDNLVASLAASALQHSLPKRIAISVRNTPLTRYDRPDFPREVVARMVQALETTGQLLRDPGAWRGLQTAIEPSASFLERVRSSGAVLADIGRAPGGETIILKAGAGTRNGRKPLIDYRDTTETRRLRREMLRINDYLNQAGIMVDGKPQLPFLLTRRFQIASPSAPQTLDRHGRIYDGFWINMHRTERYRLAIGGEDVADLDFTGMFTQLAYLEAGLRLPQGDPYGGIEGLETDASLPAEMNAMRRDAIKRCLNALYFRTGPMVRLPSVVKDQLGAEWTAERMVTALSRRHAPIAHLFGTGLGLKLMYRESQVLVRTLLDLIDLNTPALPVHDGIMVPVSRMDTAMEAMRSASEAILGAPLPVKAKPLPHPAA